MKAAYAAMSKCQRRATSDITARVQAVAIKKERRKLAARRLDESPTVREIADMTESDSDMADPPCITQFDYYEHEDESGNDIDKPKPSRAETTSTSATQKRRERAQDARMMGRKQHGTPMQLMTKTQQRKCRKKRSNKREQWQRDTGGGDMPEELQPQLPQPNPEILRHREGLENYGRPHRAVCAWTSFTMMDATSPTQKHYQAKKKWQADIESGQVVHSAPSSSTACSSTTMRTTSESTC
jgi:hypothetical protein